MSVFTQVKDALEKDPRTVIVKAEIGETPRPYCSYRNYDL